MKKNKKVQVSKKIQSPVKSAERKEVFDEALYYENQNYELGGEDRLKNRSEQVHSPLKKFS